MKESIPECERLPRGPVSRLGGDRFLAGAVPSQIVFVIVTVLSPSAGTAGWLIPVVVAVAAVPAFTWSAKICGDELICTVLGVRTMVIDLSGSKDVGVEKRSGARGMPVRVVVIHDAHVVRRIVGRDDEVVDYLALDYTRLMSRKGLNEWAASMRRVIRSSR